MDSVRRANILEAVSQIQPDAVESPVSEESQSPDSVEIPIDYSMTRKRRILDTYDVESPLAKAKKTLDYGSDGQGDERSCPGSPVQSSLTSSPEFEPSGGQILRRHPNLPEIPVFPNMIHQQMQPQSQHHAAALQLFLQVQQQQQKHHQHQHQQQQQQQHAELLQNMSVSGNYHIQPPLQWRGTPSPPITPSLPGTTAVTPKITPQSESTPTSGQGSSQEKDGAYWERRKKNNEAAKRSRDARRAKEQQIAIRAQLLEQENIRLKFELAQMRAENQQLREQFYLLHATKE